MVESRESRVKSRARSEARGAWRIASAFSLPHSPFPLPPSRFRLGISLTEVLIAMGIMTVGLLGVASVFPVGSWYMQKAEVSDNASAVAQSVMNDLVTSGKLDPRAWFMLTPSPSSNTMFDPNFLLPPDGKYTPTRTPAQSSFTRPLSESMASALALVATNSPGNENRIISRQFGNAYVIDPMGAATPRDPQGAHLNYRSQYAVPSSAFVHFPGRGPYYYTTPIWQIWGSQVSSGSARELAWPIRRVTFRSPATGWNVDRTQAEAIGRAADDVIYDFPQRADRPAIQKFETGNVGGVQTPMARAWAGDYSWIATVAPTTLAARNSIGIDPSSFEFNVSVVVFYKRTLPGSNLNTSDLFEAINQERSVGAKVLSTGLNGGELLLWNLDTNGGVEAFANLKTGQWIMLCGPHPNATADHPLFSLNWYQVMSIDSQASGVLTDPSKQRIVSVRGVEWPWQPRASYSDQNSDVAKLSDDLCVGIFRGAVAVHSKTLRLENSRRGGIAPTGVSGDPRTTSDRNPF